MPLYQYRCRTCSTEFEYLCTSARQKQDVFCPHCGAAEVDKQPAATSGLRRSSSQRADSACSSGTRFR